MHSDLWIASGINQKKLFWQTPRELSLAANVLCVISGNKLMTYCYSAVSDSDEKEFEDDPLLRVLRKQRTWVKEQIR